MNYLINMVGTAPESEKYRIGTFEEFIEWEKQQDELQLDIETDISPYWCTKQLISVQFGEVALTAFKHQWVLQWSSLNEQEQKYVKSVCENKEKCKLIHNAAFEIIVLKFHGIQVNTVYDTMLAEKIICGGMDNEHYGLADLCLKYFEITMDKSEQKTFGDDIFTENKVVYAATDVQHLDTIRRLQMPHITSNRTGTTLEEVLKLENRVVQAFADITYNGMSLDTVKWDENESLAQPVVDSSLLKLNEFLTDPEFSTKASTLGYVAPVDRILINYKSPQQKTMLLNRILPDIGGSTKAIITKYIRDNSTADVQILNMLVGMQDKDYDVLTTVLLTYHKEFLITEGLLIPANTPVINWNSVDQVLPLVQVINPRTKNLSEESLSNLSHPLLDALSDYKDSLKLVNTYGHNFVEKYVEPDGKVRTSFNQIISTGRVSSRHPNMQNIPAKESVGNRYRNAFVCEADEVFVDSDYTGQELAIIAHISQDPVWMAAIKNGEDLHSVCAELVFGKKWLEARADDCSYYKVQGGSIAKEKCNCPKHKTLRTAVKTVNFGLAYGMSEMKLSSTIRVPVPEAKALIDQYFKAFPTIGRTLKFLGDFGVKNGYIQTIYPFFRKRWFPYWKFARNSIQYHLAGQHNATLGEIERASKNQPIQGCAADMMKLAMVKAYDWIYKNGYQDSIQLVAQVHDQLTTVCKKNVSEIWKDKLDELMREAALVLIPSGILKADTQITATWTK